MRFHPMRAGVLLAALIGLNGVPAAFAQSNVNSSIVGTVRDASGGSIAGAEVVLKNLGNDHAQTVTSDRSGRYSVYQLLPGSYEITASKYGFSPANMRLAVEAHRERRADLKLKLAPSGGDAVARVDDKKLDSLEARIEQLEVALKESLAQQHAPSSMSNETAAVASLMDSRAAHGPLLATLAKDGTSIPLSPGTLSPPDLSKAVASAAAPNTAGQQSSSPSSPPSAAQNAAPVPPPVDTQTPFAFGDFTWLNGAPRNKDVVADTPFFTPEVRFDTNYVDDFNQPIDHTMGGSTEEFRSSEVQVEQASVGGDFHWQNVRGRILTMFGLFATTTPRNDASAGIGQWDLRDAYRYVSEAYGGYHWNVLHGINVDAGIFASYIGLFSYYNFDNWTYQPSYVSSNTPWFFNGVRVQIFPTNKMKIEPWFINGWQAYGKYNSHPGLGGQWTWTPREWIKIVSNEYGLGEDNIGLPKTQRIHTDNSLEVRYYNNAENSGLSKMAFSITADAGCQYGGGISCTGHGGAKSSFLGWMLYDRMWFHKDLFALTLGGGQMNNTGRYLTLLPPINGADAFSGSPYFTENAGQPAKMYDGTINIQYMPRQYITWWAEAGYRHSDVPYFSGRGGITPPGGNNGAPADFACLNGTSSGTGSLAAAQVACGGANNVWFPDLRKSTSSIGFGVMVKF